MSEPLWTAAEAAAATGGTASADWRATGVSIDSRTVAAGDLFVAIRGPNNDGHAYVAAALAAGAVAALVDRRPEGLAADAPLLAVADTQAGLEALGRAARARTRARIAGVTGSVGKTGSKEALRTILAVSGDTHASAGSLNNQWGVPLSLARMPRACDFAIFELGMNHPGELGPLSRMVAPEVALITTVEPAHMAFFPSVEAVADAKAEIFEGLRHGGTAVLYRDNPHFERLAAAARTAGAGRVLAFGSGADCDARLLDAAPDGDGMRVGASFHGRRLDYRTGAAGRHWAINSLAVLLVATALGAGLERSAAAFAGVAAPKGRGARLRVVLPGGAFTLLDESYNASPAAVRAGLAVLAGVPLGPSGRRIAVLGDMLELGERADALHRDLAADVAAAGVDLLFACGPHMAALYGALEPGRRGAHAADSARLLPAVLEAVGPGDAVMVKGSLGMRMAPVVEALLRLAERPRAAGAGG